LAVLLVAGLTPLPADPWWQESRTIARLMPLVERAASYLPESITEYLDFEPGDAPEKDAKDDPEEGAEESAAAQPDAEQA
jgi:uncharacterized membrane protein required for colicin V production